MGCSPGLGLNFSHDSVWPQANFLAPSHSPQLCKTERWQSHPHRMQHPRQEAVGGAGSSLRLAQPWAMAATRRPVTGNEPRLEWGEAGCRVTWPGWGEQQRALPHPHPHPAPPHPARLGFQLRGSEDPGGSPRLGFRSAPPRSAPTGPGPPRPWSPPLLHTVPGRLWARAL